MMSDLKPNTIIINTTDDNRGKEHKKLRGVCLVTWARASAGILVIVTDF